jgi:hypothetical protein
MLTEILMRVHLAARKRACHERLNWSSRHAGDLQQSLGFALVADKKSPGHEGPGVHAE